MRVAGIRGHLLQTGKLKVQNLRYKEKLPKPREDNVYNVAKWEGELRFRKHLESTEAYCLPAPHYLLLVLLEMCRDSQLCC